MDSLEPARSLFNAALARQQAGELEEARELYERALEAAPGRPSVMNNLAAVYLSLKRYGEAKRLCQELLGRDPGDETALLNLGSCEDGLGAPEEALGCYDRALAIKADYAEALSNRGSVLLRLQRADEALASYDRALGVKADYAEAHYNRGNALLQLGRREDAIASYEGALALKPSYPEALYNRGNALLKLRRPEEALASYEGALALKPDYSEALNNRGLVLLQLGRREALIENYRALLGVAPDFPYGPGYLLNAQLQCCEWGDYAESVARVAVAVRAGKRADSPFNFLAISGSPQDQLQCARTCVADEYPAASRPVWGGERYPHDRIRVAYLSADLHAHAVPFLIAGMIEAHDRTRFEITAISLGPDRNDAMRARLQAAFDRFIDVRDRSDREVAELLRAQEIDIAVDLQGFTLGCRPGIFSYRGAPLQVNYLGYPGTMGAEYMDYIIADRQLIPAGHERYYTEKVVRMPHCYQPNDAKRRIAERTPARAELKLPEHGFVFCCFNNNYKIAPAVFDVWMRLLNRVPGSVLWLLEDNEIASRNLRREAERRGVAPERLVFAPRTRVEDHLARHRQADLFLDTLPYCAHTTASDALWAGLPVLTRLGDAFAGRVAASLLHAVGLPELVTTTAEEYERVALQLATDGERLAGIRAKLSRNRDTHPLFDTDSYRKHIEAAYVTMWERAQRGEPPQSFAVPETAFMSQKPFK